jgi:uncharacterized protein
MAFQNPSQEELRQILLNARNIAVIGLSDNPNRTSYAIARSMQQRGYHIFPVNPSIDSVLGESAYVNVTDIKEPIDIINVFRKSEALPQVMADCVKTDAPVVWCQQGVYHEEASEIGQAAGKTVVMDRCIAVVHSALVQNR